MSSLYVNVDQCEYSDVEYVHEFKKLFVLVSGPRFCIHYLYISMLNWLKLNTSYYNRIVMKADICMLIHNMRFCIYYSYPSIFNWYNYHICGLLKIVKEFEQWCLNSYFFLNVVKMHSKTTNCNMFWEVKQMQNNNL